MDIDARFIDVEERHRIAATKTQKMKPASQESPLRWTPTAGGPLVQMTCLYDSGQVSRLIKRVKLAPGAATAVVQDILPDHTQTVRVYDTSTWRELWTIPLPPREPCTSGRDIGALFLSATQYVITHQEMVLLADRENVVWRITLPIPDQWTVDPLRMKSNAKEWALLSSSDPRAESGRLYIHTHWEMNLGSNSHFYEPEFEDRAAVETLSIDDGRWLGRIEVPFRQPVPTGVMPVEKLRTVIRDRARIELMLTADVFRRDLTVESTSC